MGLDKKIIFAFLVLKKKHYTDMIELYLDKSCIVARSSLFFVFLYYPGAWDRVFLYFLLFKKVSNGIRQNVFNLVFLEKK